MIPTKRGLSVNIWIYSCAGLPVVVEAKRLRLAAGGVANLFLVMQNGSWKLSTQVAHKNSGGASLLTDHSEGERNLPYSCIHGSKLEV